MDQATASAAPAAIPQDGAGSAAPPRRTPRQQLTRDLILLGVIFVLLAAAIWAGFSALYRQYWGPSAFVERYLELIAEGRAADALTVPGVAIDSADLEAAGLPVSASEALLRSAALTFGLRDVDITQERPVAGGYEVTAAYAIDGTRGQTVFTVRRSGTEGIVPRWSFETSPLGMLEVGVRGSMQFEVNDFEMDKRQVSPDGVDADPLAPVSLLVFSPGLYTVEVDTPTAEAEPVHVLADAALRKVPLDIQAQPTEAFADVVQQQVGSFLAECATQKVLQPTGCPFGIQIDDRVFPETLAWSILATPGVEIVPDGAHWAISPATGTAHIEVDVQALSTGAVYHLSEDVPFVIDGTVEILPDGTASILVGSPALR
ncbi:hypothetical protein [Microbacterium sp. MEC084]|uniref:hypothetical protein n=1 Tax=Microbacterium sp. MEC084 TaxID=1963027 RepID=UPI0011055EE4|nr:hypothetical protein [Microbacterium sp. MEC084]